MTDLQVRRATPDDAAELAAVYRSAYSENRRLGFPAKAGSATAEQVAGWIRECRVFVAEVEGGDRNGKGDSEYELVGGVRLESTDDDCVKLSRLGVRENWKGESVGSRLLDRAEDAVREWGYGTVRLTTPGEHPHLPEFYRRRGYEKTGPHPLDFREYDEIVMEKRVE